jgi:hypothetical protein
MTLVLKTLVEHLSRFKQQKWSDTPPTADDMAHIQKEALEDSQFDPFMLRRSMFERFQRGEVICRSRSCGNAKVIAFYEKGSRDPTPWELWSRIFSAFGRGREEKPWRIIWFAHPRPRLLPGAEKNESGYQVEAKHINGGYAYPCDPSSIIIYRKEEATRVLIHELLHASCTDKHSLPTELKEAATEAWAELFLIGLLAGTSVSRAEKLWKLQAAWIANQHHILTTKYGVRGPSDYSWRYTIGRLKTFEALGLVIPAAVPAVATRMTSARFTTAGLGV